MAVSDSEVDLAWDAVDGATGYEVDRQNLDDTWTTLTTGIDSGTAASYPDTSRFGRDLNTPIAWKPSTRAAPSVCQRLLHRH